MFLDYKANLLTLMFSSGKFSYFFSYLKYICMHAFTYVNFLNIYFPPTKVKNIFMACVN